jgi:hypothetical protein
MVERTLRLALQRSLERLRMPTISMSSMKCRARLSAVRSPPPAPQEDQHLSCAAGRKLDINEVDEGIWLVSFMQYDLGYFDLEQKTLQPLDNPLGTRLSPMSQVRSVTYVSGPDN